MDNKHSEPKPSTPASSASGGGISGLAIRRPVFATMVMLGLIVLGIFGFNRLAVDEFPDVEIPFITVQTTYPGASAQTMEREVSRRMEEAFNPVEGVKRIMSNSLEGVSLVMIEFELDRNADLASQDIRAKLEGIRRDLPQDIDPPIVQKFDPQAIPIISIAMLTETMPLVNLTSLADETIRRRIESVRGVGEVRIAGGLKREVRVFVQPNKLQSMNITIPQLMGALQAQNLEIPAGRVEQRGTEQLVRVTGRITDPAQFGDIFITNRNGQPIRVRDVARVEDANEEERSLAMVNGTRAVSLDILKISGANTVDVAEGVRAAVEDIQKNILPAGVTMQVVRDNSVSIRQSVDSVIHELLLGALLTVVVVMLFLNDWKATAITSLALPVSVISAFVLMNALGFTLNVLTLMALSLSIGILIDDAIVVVENIVRHREMGEDHFTAARLGTVEIVLAVLATTLSIVAVFVPVAFMGGIIGRFFYQFGVTVAWAVLVSLFVSFTLTPMLSAWWGVDPHKGSEGGGNFITRPIAKFNAWFDRSAKGYRRIIEWALSHRLLTLGIAGAALLGSFMLFPLIGGGFFPDADNSEFSLQFETPEGSSLAYTQGKAQQITNILKTMDEVSYTYTTIGSGATGTVTKGEFYVKLTPTSERSRSQADMMVYTREQMKALVGVRTSVLVADNLGGAQAPLAVEIRGLDVAQLQILADTVLKIVGGIPGIVDAKSSLGQPKPEFRIDVDRDIANQVGLNIGQIATTIRPILAGEVATRWEDPSGEERDVVVQVPPEQRRTAEDIAMIPVATSQYRADGSPVTIPLRDVANIQLSEAPAQIDRKDLQRIATIAASTDPSLSVAEASTKIREAVASLDLPPGYSVGLGGETEQLEETGGYVVQTLLLAVILIYLILASQFESFMQPFAIMMSLPLSLIGVLLALLITNDTLNMMSMIGVIMLMGLVTKNAILLVDNANERRRHGTDKFQALIEAGEVRLRPIIMTTLAMIFGMLPIALAMGEGGGFRAPMARAVIGGLITSTMLTLVVVPVVYTYFDGFGDWMKHKFVSKEREQQLAEEREAAGF